MVRIRPTYVKNKYHSSSSNLRVVPQVHHHPLLLIWAYTKGICKLVAPSPASVVLHVQVVNSNGLTTSRPESGGLAILVGPGGQNIPIEPGGLAILAEPGDLSILVESEGMNISFRIQNEFTF